MRVALVYDRVNKWGGAERVLLALHEMFPKAPLYTSVYSPQKAPWAKVFPKVVPSFLQNLKPLRDKHELLAPLMPIAFESFNFDEYDLIISITSEAAKGIIVKPPTKHICYCLTPTRYLWSHHRSYFKNSIFKAMSKPIVNYLRCWDKIAAQRPDVMIAISSEVKKRIKKYYDRDSVIIHPPVDTCKFNKKPMKISTGLRSAVEGRSNNSNAKKGDFYLVVSRLVVYKRVDLVIKAFNNLGYSLVIIGTGREEQKLKKLAKTNIKFIKNLTDDELVNYYVKAHALIMPQEEDFGLVAIEAQAAGTPVIAYKKGGALDTVVEGQTGVFFDKQDSDSLISAVKKFEKIKFNKKALFNNAKKFSKEKFKKNFSKLTKNA